MTEILEQLEINETFFYQFILFGVLFFVLSAIYLKPFQRLLTKRNQKLNDDVQGAAELLRTVESRLSDYERALSHARHEALTQYEAAVAQVRAQEETQIAAIKADLKKDFVNASNQLQEEKLKVESELKLQLGAISDSVVQKMISGR